jgi:hypothetical protein
LGTQISTQWSLPFTNKDDIKELEEFGEECNIFGELEELEELEGLEVDEGDDELNDDQGDEVCWVLTNVFIEKSPRYFATRS